MSRRSIFTGGRALVLTLLAAGESGCDEGLRTTGGTSIKRGECGRGVVVVNTEYSGGTSVSLVGWDREVLSPLFAYSGQVDSLQGTFLADAVAPSTETGGDVIALVERFPNAALSFFHVQTGALLRQMSVRTGFESNPHDFIPLGGNRAYIPRFDPNKDPGKEPFDGGSDIVIIDAELREITGRIDLAAALAGEGDEGFFPRPSRGLTLSDRVVVVLSGYSKDFATSAPSRLVTIDPMTDTITDVLVLSGKHGCDGIAASADEALLAITCLGEFGGDSASSLPESGLVIVRNGETLTEEKRFDAEPLGSPVGFSASFADKDHVLFTTLGRSPLGEDPGAEAAYWVADLKQGTTQNVLGSKAPFSLGDVRCARTCGVCFAADADARVLHAWSVDPQQGLTDHTTLQPDTVLGLAPRYLGGF